ncbi:unnamed protein product [Candidatus Protochlamydia amoebophila UWE25]|uniref:Uncharacterized protein n=1 Tax=Protochlamydia amoebophila (strain UWE25) TaxID=264201 RepID=Q6MF03_PARUW|nr:unnamed protein product [Candidatus Protochlamydia amoebophila UWE25]
MKSISCLKFLIENLLLALAGGSACYICGVSYFINQFLRLFSHKNLICDECYFFESALSLKFMNFLL